MDCELLLDIGIQNKQSQRKASVYMQKHEIMYVQGIFTFLM